MKRLEGHSIRRRYPGDSENAAHTVTQSGGSTPLRVGRQWSLTTTAGAACRPDPHATGSAHAHAQPAMPPPARGPGGPLTARGGRGAGGGGNSDDRLLPCQASLRSGRPGRGAAPGFGLHQRRGPCLPTSDQVVAVAAAAATGRPAPAAVGEKRRRRGGAAAPSRACPVATAAYAPAVCPRSRQSAFSMHREG